MNLDELDTLEPARLPFPVTRSVGDAPKLKGDEKPRLYGRFSTFGDPYEIDSHIEGRFLESIKPGAFRKTIAESRDQMKVLFDHGQDPQMGNMILGSIESLAEDSRGPAYEVETFDGIPPLLLNGLRAGAYGSSFRFSVEKDVWDYNPERSDANPDGIPERTITEARVFEFGPVTFPANPAATAGVRSTTDAFYQRSRDPEAFETLLRSAQVARAPKGAVAAEPPPTTLETEPVRSDTPPAQSEPTVENRTVDQEYTAPDQRESRITELRSILQRVGTEHTGVLPVAVQAQWDADSTELRRLEADSAAYEQRMAQLRGIAERQLTQSAPQTQNSGGNFTGWGNTPPNFVRPPEDIHDLQSLRGNTRSREEYSGKVRDYALRSIDAAKFGKSANVDALISLVERDRGENSDELAERILTTGSPTYRKAFSKYVSGKKDLWTQEEARAAALAVTATTTTGGYAVPYVFDPTMIRVGAYTAQNPYRAACRTVTITNGNVWKGVTVTATTAVYGTEAQPSVEAGPTFAQPSYQVQTAQSFVTLSIETMEDRPDITEELTLLFGEAKSTLEENQFTLGVGTGASPKGMFLVTAYTVKATATNDVTALLDFTATEADLPLRFRAKAQWFMNRSTIRQLQILDTSYRYFSGAGIQYPGAVNGTLNPNTPPNVQSNTGMYLLGYPIWEVPSAVSTLTTDQAVIAVLADPSSYIIVDRIGMNVEVIPQMLNGATPSFPTLQRGVLCYWRNYAAPHTADAGRQVKVQ